MANKQTKTLITKEKTLVKKLLPQMEEICKQAKALSIKVSKTLEKAHNLERDYEDDTLLENEDMEESEALNTLIEMLSGLEDDVREQASNAYGIKDEAKALSK